MYEALLREGMDTERSEQFDALLEQVSDEDLTMEEKGELLLGWGGDAVIC